MGKGQSKVCPVPEGKWRCIDCPDIDFLMVLHQSQDEALTSETAETIGSHTVSIDSLKGNVAQSATGLNTSDSCDESAGSDDSLASLQQSVTTDVSPVPLDPSLHIKPRSDSVDSEEEPRRKPTHYQFLQNTKHLENATPPSTKAHDRRSLKYSAMNVVCEKNERKFESKVFENTLNNLELSEVREPNSGPEAMACPDPLKQSTILSDNKEKGAYISSLFQIHFISLIKEMDDPSIVARHLYGLGILNDDQLKKASNHFIDSPDRAQNIVLLLKGRHKFHYTPKLFSDTCTALRRAKVYTIDKIKADFERKYAGKPITNGKERSVTVHEFESSHVDTRNTKGYCSEYQSAGCVNKRLHKCTCSTLESTNSTYLQETITSLEKAIKRNCSDEELGQIIFKATNHENGQSLLFKACACNVDARVLDTLLKHIPSLDVNAINQNRRTPLHTACAALGHCHKASPAHDLQRKLKQQQRTKIQTLLNLGAQPNAQDNDGNTVLHLAVLRRDLEALRIVLALTHTDTHCIDLTNKLGNTALLIACKKGYIKLVQLLCKNEANVHIPNTTRKQNTPLTVSCSCERVDVAEFIVSHDSSSLKDTDGRGRSSLHLTAIRSNATLTETLLESSQAEPYTLDQKRYTPLHYACYWANDELVHPLLSRNSSPEFINAQDSNQETALHIACRRGKKRLVELLVSKGANLATKNWKGKIPLEIASEHGHKKIVKFLVERSTKRHGQKAAPTRLRRVSSEPVDLSSRMVFSSAESDSDETIADC